MKFNRENENYVYSFVGKNVQYYRKQKGITQQQLADQTNYSKQFISNIENNVHQTFSLGTLWRISLVLEIKFENLFIENKID